MELPLVFSPTPFTGLSLRAGPPPTEHPSTRASARTTAAEGPHPAPGPAGPRRRARRLRRCRRPLPAPRPPTVSRANWREWATSPAWTRSSASPWWRVLVALLGLGLSRRPARPPPRRWPPPPTGRRPPPPPALGRPPPPRWPGAGGALRRPPRPPRPRRRRPPRPTSTTVPPVAGPVTAVGDSIMIDIQPYLQTDIPGVDRRRRGQPAVRDGIGVVQADRAAGTLGSVLVVELGTNGSVTSSDFDAMMQAAAGVKRVVFVNINVPRPWEAPDNAVLAAGVARYPGVAVLADWNTVSTPHPEWFTAGPGAPPAGRSPGPGRPGGPVRLTDGTHPGRRHQGDRVKERVRSSTVVSSPCATQGPCRDSNRSPVSGTTPPGSICPMVIAPPYDVVGTRGAGPSGLAAQRQRHPGRAPRARPPGRPRPLRQCRPPAAALAGRRHPGGGGHAVPLRLPHGVTRRVTPPTG